MIYFDKNWIQFIKYQNFQKLEDYDLKRALNPISQIEDNDFFVSWGENVKKTKHAVIETGFFKDSLHIDRVGLYANASFNFQSFQTYIENYEAPISWKNLPLKQKFKQPEKQEKWHGIVLPLQHHNDRSVLSVGSSKDYHNFVENACKYYGSKILLKKHPVTLGNKEEMARVEEIALRYNCIIDHVDTSIINHAEFVLVYNSTFVIDALMRNKHVVHFAPGYFWQSKVCQYSHYTFPNKLIQNNVDYINKFLDFLPWKYCIHYGQSIEKYSKIIKKLANENEIYPLPEEYSYANYILTNEN